MKRRSLFSLIAAIPAAIFSRNALARPIKVKQLQAEWYLDADDPSEGHGEPWDILMYKDRRFIAEIHGAAVIEKTFWAFLAKNDDDNDNDDDCWKEFATEAEAQAALDAHKKQV